MKTVDVVKRCLSRAFVLGGCLYGFVNYGGFRFSA